MILFETRRLNFSYLNARALPLVCLHHRNVSWDIFGAFFANDDEFSREEEVNDPSMQTYTVEAISRAKSSNGGDDAGSCKRVSRESCESSLPEQTRLPPPDGRKTRSSSRVFVVAHRSLPSLLHLHILSLSHIPHPSPPLSFSSANSSFHHLLVCFSIYLLIHLPFHPRAFPSFPCLRIYLLLCFHFLPLHFLSSPLFSFHPSVLVLSRSFLCLCLVAIAFLSYIEYSILYRVE